MEFFANRTVLLLLMLVMAPLILLGLGLALRRRSVTAGSVLIVGLLLAAYSVSYLMKSFEKQTTQNSVRAWVIKQCGQRGCRTSENAVEGCFEASWREGYRLRHHLNEPRGVGSWSFLECLNKSEGRSVFLPSDIAELEKVSQVP